MIHSICINEQDAVVVRLGQLTENDAGYIEECLDDGQFKKNGDVYTYNDADRVKFDRIVRWVVDFFTKRFGSEGVDICDAVRSKLQSINDEKELFNDAMDLGKAIKEKDEHDPDLPSRFHRQLMNYQKMSVEHLIKVGNAANFSVPGSGKTTITYAAVSRWQEDGMVEKILVIGPTASFLPWEEEYEGCFGAKPKSMRISGGVSGIFHELGESYDLFLMHFNTAMNRSSELKKFMDQWKTVLIIDESHYIKNPELRRWGRTVMDIAPHAKRRIALSGTPMPNNAKDLWTQITFLWPHNFPLGKRPSYNSYAKRNGIGKHAGVLNQLFCRIKKNDLDLPKPEWIREDIPLAPVQKCIYDAIAMQTLKELEDMNIQDQAQLQRFRMAKLIRLLQASSNPTLLSEMSSTFDVTGEEFKDRFGEAFGMAPIMDNVPGVDGSLIDKIRGYTKHEIPSKIFRVSSLTRKLVNEGNKVIIWSTFVHNMNVFQDSTLKDLEPIVINGTVPREGDGPETRDKLINRFKNKKSMVLIASPASLAESVSLHKNLRGENVCNHAIYLDRNFNGAQYMQSMDRIHRIGMDGSAEVRYYLIVAQGTIDEAIDRRLKEKQEEMLKALNDDMLESLDINPRPRIIDSNEFDKDYQAVVKHLREVYGK